MTNAFLGGLHTSKQISKGNSPGEIKASPSYSFKPNPTGHTEHAAGSKSEATLPFFFTYKAVSSLHEESLRHTQMSAEPIKMQILWNSPVNNFCSSLSHHVRSSAQVFITAYGGLCQTLRFESSESLSCSQLRNNLSAGSLVQSFLATAWLQAHTRQEETAALRQLPLPGPKRSLQFSSARLLPGCWLPCPPAFAFRHLIAEVEIQMLSDRHMTENACLLLWGHVTWQQDEKPHSYEGSQFFQGKMLKASCVEPFHLLQDQTELFLANWGAACF